MADLLTKLRVGLATAPQCADPFSFDLARDQLEGEKCYLLYYCGAAEGSAGRRAQGGRRGE